VSVNGGDDNSGRCAIKHLSSHGPTAPKGVVAGQKKKKNFDVPRGGSFSEHLAIESMRGRHTPIPLQFDAHGLKITSISLRT
jgi:hypothetical protein